MYKILSRFFVLLTIICLNNFSFSQQGESCADPLSATVGENVPSNLNETAWFTYKNDSSNTLKVTMSANTFFYVYSKCEPGTSFALESGNRFENVELNLAVDDSLIIQVNPGENLSIQVESQPAGASCSDPIDVMPGVTYTLSDPNSGLDEWFRYTNETNDMHIVTKSNTLNVKATFECDFANIFKPHVLPGESVFFRIKNIATWSFTIESVPMSNTCAQAREVLSPTNVISYFKQGEQWYSYTNNSSGTEQVELSSCGTTYHVGFYDECGGTVLAENDQTCTPDEKITGTVRSGETIYFIRERWQSTTESLNNSFFVNIEPVLNIKDNKHANISVFPTVFENFLVIEKEVERVTVFNMNGDHQKTFSNTDRMDLSELSPGRYLLEITDDQLVSHIKVLKL